MSRGKLHTSSTFITNLWQALSATGLLYYIPVWMTGTAECACPLRLGLYRRLETGPDFTYKIDYLYGNSYTLINHLLT